MFIYACICIYIHSHTLTHTHIVHTHILCMNIWLHAYMCMYDVHCIYVFICEYKCIVIKQAFYNFNPLLT